MGGTVGVGGTGLNGGLFGSGGLWALLWILVLVIVIGVGVYVIAIRTNRRGTDTDSALAALRERYARGEIDTDEFNRRRAMLSGPTP